MMDMTREDANKHINTIYDTVKPVLEIEAPPGGMELVDAGFCLFAGLIDAILEIRDNGREADNPNPFGVGSRHQSKVGQG
jgi:hypothetical protein